MSYTSCIISLSPVTIYIDISTDILGILEQDLLIYKYDENEKKDTFKLKILSTDKLQELESSFHNIETEKLHDPIFTALDDAISKFNIPKHYYLELISGVKSDITKNRFNNFDELSIYCYQVASVIGLICIEIFGYKDSIAKKYAIELGYAMQITNILRDLKEDSKMDRIYIPLDEIKQFNYSEFELKKFLKNKNFNLLMKFQADRAQKYYK